MNIIDRFAFWLLRQKRNWKRRDKPQPPPPSCNDCKFQLGEWCHHPVAIQKTEYILSSDRQFAIPHTHYYYTTAQMREPWWRCRPEGQWFEPKN